MRPRDGEPEGREGPHPAARDRRGPPGTVLTLQAVSCRAREVGVPEAGLGTAYCVWPWGLSRLSCPPPLPACLLHPGGGQGCPGDQGGAGGGDHADEVGGRAPESRSQLAGPSDHACSSVPGAPTLVCTQARYRNILKVQSCKCLCFVLFVCRHY